MYSDTDDYRDFDSEAGELADIRSEQASEREPLTHTFDTWERAAGWAHGLARMGHDVGPVERTPDGRYSITDNGPAATNAGPDIADLYDGAPFPT
jgi:hypothetical protein